MSEHGEHGERCIVAREKDVWEFSEEATARAKAEELARKTPGVRYAVYRRVDAVEATVPPVMWDGEEEKEEVLAWTTKEAIEQATSDDWWLDIHPRCEGVYNVPLYRRP